MKRFGFFLAVFSIGLVLFLLVSGQFGEMFSTGERPDDGGRPDPFVEERAGSDGATGEGAKRNLVRTEETDHDLGRPLFFIEGEIAGAVEVDVTMRTNVQNYVFENVKLELPLYSDRAQVEPVDAFLLEVEEARYEALSADDPQAEARRSTSEVRLLGSLSGQGRITGFPQFETRGGLLTWDADSAAHLRCEEQVDLRYPAVALRTQSGLDAHVAGRTGLQEIELHPPLVVALSSDATGSILGFDATATDGEGSGEDRSGVREGSNGESRVHLFSLGPMHIDPSDSTAVIEGPVFIYQVPADTSLNPPELKDLPEHYFRCERLTLALDGKSRAITRLVAERVEEPVQVFLGDRYRIEGDRLEWSLGTREAVLGGDVKIVGDVGEVDAGGARIRPDVGLCTLVDGVHATLRGSALVRSRLDPGHVDSDGGGWDERLAGTWELDAATAELHYSTGAGKRSLQMFRAIAPKGERVTVREVRDDGAVLHGGTMTYTPSTGIVSVLAGADGVRPEFREGRNSGTAGRIDASILRPILEFSEEVDVVLVEPPIGTDEKWSQWWTARTDAEGRPVEVQTTLRAERVRLSSDVDRRLSSIEAWGREGVPLELEHRAERTLRFFASSVDWDGPAGRITATGGSSQRMVLDGRADLVARELEFSLESWVATARGDFVGTLVQLPPGGAEGPAPAPVEVRGDRAEISLRPPPPETEIDREGAVVGATAGENAPRTGRPSAGGDRTGEVIAAHVYADRPEGLSIDDGILRLVGDEWQWDAVRDEFRLGGGRGRQRVFSRRPAGEDELSADNIVYRGADRVLLLEGDARGTIHQGSVAPELEPESAHLPWEVYAGRMTVHFRVEGEEGRLVPDRFVAGSEVRLEQKDSLIEFRGNTAEWDFTTERLRVYSPDGPGLQTLTQGGARGSEIIAREILVVRPTPLRAGSLDTLEALFIEVLRAEVLLAAEEGEDPEATRGFTLRCDNLLASFSGLRAADAPEGDPLGMPISEVRAWGNVDFQGGEYHLVCHRAAYRRTTRNLVFQGDGRSKVQVLSQSGAAIRPLSQKELSLEWLANRTFRVRAVPGGAQWSSAQIEESLRLFDRVDRRDRGN